MLPAAAAVCRTVSRQFLTSWTKLFVCARIVPQKGRERNGLLLSGQTTNVSEQLDASDLTSWTNMKIHASLKAGRPEMRVSVFLADDLDFKNVLFILKSIGIACIWKNAHTQSWIKSGHRL